MNGKCEANKWLLATLSPQDGKKNEHSSSAFVGVKDLILKVTR
jgi:hypothetical protein